MGNEVEIVVSANTMKAQKGLEGIRGRLQKLAPGAKIAGAALTGVGIAGGLMAKSFIDAARQQELAERTLGAVIDQSGESWDAQREKVLAATAALQQKTNFGDEEQLAILAKMIPILGSTEAALAALPAVLDTASASGKSVSTVAETLSKALAGATDTSATLGIQFDKDTGFAERLAEVMGRVGGAAEANADPMIQLGNTLGDFRETMGKALLPIVDKFALRWTPKFGQVAKRESRS